ncbi:hypothetical protein ACHAXS_003149 [Conticribra weissflogii]
MTTKHRRVTIIKPTVGKVKSSSYSLPDSDFVYGIESKLDKEGAGQGTEVIRVVRGGIASSWQYCYRENTTSMR